MSKKKILAGLFTVLGAATLTLASCGQKDEFDQNTENIPAKINMYIVGSHWNNWNPSTIADTADFTFMLDENSSGLNNKYVYTANVTAENVAAWCGFKFVGATGWEPQYGMEDVDFSKCNEAFLTQVVGDKNNDGKVDVKDKYTFREGTSNRNNIVATVPGTYVIEYYPYNFTSETVDGVLYQNKFVITFTPAA